MPNILNLDTTILYDSITNKTPEEEERIKQGLKKMSHDRFIIKIARARADAIRTYKRINNHQTNSTLYKDIQLLT